MEYYIDHTKTSLILWGKVGRQYVRFGSDHLSPIKGGSRRFLSLLHIATKCDLPFLTLLTFPASYSMMIHSYSVTMQGMKARYLKSLHQKCCIFILCCCWLFCLLVFFNIWHTCLNIKYALKRIQHSCKSKKQTTKKPEIQHPPTLTPILFFKFMVGNKNLKLNSDRMQNTVFCFTCLLTSDNDSIKTLCRLFLLLCRSLPLFVKMFLWLFFFFSSNH